MSFWDGMQLWEKMLLVLGIAMVLVLFWAALKLILSKRAVKQHTTLAETRKAHLESIRGSRHIILLKGEDIPFGIKALESGIEVEGIVISRPPSPNSHRSQNTLVGSDSETALARGQAQQMRQSGRPMVYQPSPYMSLPPHLPASGPPSHWSSTTSVVSVPPKAASRGGDSPPGDGRSTRSDPAPTPRSGSITPPTHIPDPATLAKLEGRNASPPAGVWRTRSPTNPSPATHSPSPNSPPPQSPSPQNRQVRSPSRTPTPPEDNRSIILPSANENCHGESGRESDSSIDSEILEDTRMPLPRLLSACSTPVMTSQSPGEHIPETARGDLSLLYTHRISHAAEVGQLLPRTPRNTAPSLPRPIHSASSSFSSPSVLLSPAEIASDFIVNFPPPPIPESSHSTLHPDRDIKANSITSSWSFESGETAKFAQGLRTPPTRDVGRVSASTYGSEGSKLSQYDEKEGLYQDEKSNGYTESISSSTVERNSSVLHDWEKPLPSLPAEPVPERKQSCKKLQKWRPGSAKSLKEIDLEAQI